MVNTLAFASRKCFEHALGGTHQLSYLESVSSYAGGEHTLDAPCQYQWLSIVRLLAQTSVLGCSWPLKRGRFGAR